MTTTEMEEVQLKKQECLNDVTTWNKKYTKTNPTPETRNTPKQIQPF